jgi:hypothetical protein
VPVFWDGDIPGTLRATLARAHLHREELRISEYGDNQEIFQSKLELASPA